MRVTVEQQPVGRLSEMPPEAEVRLAHQPSWPFEYRLDSWSPAVVAKNGDNEDVVYLVEGGQVGYLPGSAAEEIGW